MAPESLADAAGMLSLKGGPPIFAPRPNGVLVRLSGRNPILGDVYQVESHVQVPEPSGRIFIVYMSLHLDDMMRLFDFASRSPAPKDEQEVHDRGFLVVDPEKHDMVFIRDSHGTGEEDTDILKTWTTCRSDYSPAELIEFAQLQQDLLGKEDEICPGAPTKVGKDRVGGIAFERQFRGKPVKTGTRTYPVSTTVQVQKALLAPAAGCKRSHTVPIEGRLVKLGALASVKGMEKAPEKTRDALATQADLLNIPHIGNNENCYHTSFQLNVASAVGTSSAATLNSDLGKFGSSHIDGNDSSAAPTSMTILSKTSDKVRRELFCILDLGVACIMVELSSVFFSGLHFHAGMVTQLIVPSEEDLKIVQMTLIKYPPSSVFDTASALAFAALPPKGPDAKRECFNVAIEMRNPYRDARTAEYLLKRERLADVEVNDGVEGSGGSIEAPAIKPSKVERPTEQATFTFDGGQLMERQSYLDHFARNIAQIVAYFSSQVPTEYQLRFDRDRLLSAFSILSEDDVRIRAKDWHLGPGWKESDIKIGQKEDPDHKDEYPYNNPERLKGMEKFGDHVHEQSLSIPICLLGDEMDINTDNIIGLVRSSHKQGTLNDISSAMVGTELVTVDGGDGEDEDDPSLDDESSRATDMGSLIVPETVLEATDVRIDKSNPDDHDGGDYSDHDSDYAPTGTSCKHSANSEPSTSTHASKRSKKGKTKAVKAAKGSRTNGNASRSAANANTQKAGPRKKKSRKAQDVDLPDSGDDNEVDVGFNVLELQSVDTTCVFDLDTLNCVQEHIGRVDPKPDNPDFLKALVNLTTNTGRGVFEDVFTISSSFSLIQVRKDLGHLSMRFTDMLCNVLNLLLWEWLDNLLGQDLDWLTILRRKVWSSFSDPLKAHTFSLATYLPKYTNPASADYSTTIRQRKAYVSENGEEVEDRLFDILGSWFNFPPRKHFQPLAWLTREFVDYFGMEALVLPGVMRIDRDVSAIIRSKGRISVSGWRSTIREWAEIRFIDHTLVRPCSEERACLKDVFGIVEKAYPTIRTWTSLVEPEARRRFKIESSFVDPLSDLLLVMMPLFDDPHRTIDLPASKTTKLYAWKAFMLDVQDDLDQRLPFRDLAPSRNKVLYGSGPYSAEYLVSRAGFFSALVYRGITHNTEFLMDQENTVFPTLEVWNKLYDGLKEFHDEDWFCNKRAYGQTCLQRNVVNAPSYWKSSGDPKLLLWLFDNKPWAFIDVFSLIRKAKIPAFGKLTTYLLVADYAIAGVVKKPSCVEMGHMIYHIKLGGWHGLQKLGYPCRSADETARSFESVYNIMLASMEDGYRDDVKFDVFLLEHLLCKHSRLSDLELWDNALKEMNTGIEFIF
ncbi:hypothetical protein BDN72DRAFT_863066 [Pluteus cervinus]|uniref:Uncharacterized protein n=1 Tax=Pluteus cervinus TaxID=181527 RepID=A0ACD3A8E3_9AGAR|nr:hypothetical protein BDN72DRAFT_863066 [Pluteus cervinus]